MSWLLHLVQIGGENVSPRRYRQILLINISSAAAFLITSSYQIFYLFYGVPVLSLIFIMNSICLAAYLLIFWLNFSRRYRLASIVLVCVACIQVLVADLVFGIDTHFFYFVAIGLLPFLFYRLRLGLLMLMGLLVVVLYLLAQSGGPWEYLPASVLRIMHVGNVVASMGMIMVLVYLFNQQIMQAENALEQSNRSLARQNVSDELTGLANRRGLMLALERDWQQLRRGKGSLSLLLCDVDYFKAYNDNYGHPAGDEVLRQVARALKEVVRRSLDTAARYGGEEFVAILPGTGLAGARQLAEEFRMAVEELAMAHEHSGVSSVVTVSVGLATMSADSKWTAAELLAAADEALYAAKGGGRNCVAVHQVSD